MIGIGAHIKNIYRKGINGLRNLNLFRSPVPVDNEEQQLKNEFISTRIFLCLLLISLLIFVIYTSQVQVTRTMTISSPTLSFYSSLYEKYGEIIVCPCSKIIIPQEEFLTLFSTFHPICTSDFINSRWPNGIYNSWSDIYVYNRDFRFRGSQMFEALSSICSLANVSIYNDLIDFQSSAFLSSNVLPERVFIPQVNASIDLFLASTANTFTRSFRLIRDTTQGNGLVSSTLSSLSFRLVFKDNSSADAFAGQITLRFKKYNNQTCSCHDTATCKEQAYVYMNNVDNVPVYLVEGFVIGCYVFEGLLQSNLICLFNQSCIDRLRQAIAFSDNFTTSALDFSKLSTHQLNTTVETLMETIMVEQWTRDISYTNYFNQCRPIYCKYTYTSKYDIFYIITTIIALIGGLMTILQIVIPRVVRFVQWLINKREQRRITVNVIS